VKIDYRWTGTVDAVAHAAVRSSDTNIYYMQGYSGHGVTCTHLAGRLISELLRGDAERFDAFAKLPHYPFPGGRSLRIPFTAMGAAYYSLRDRLGVKFSANPTHRAVPQSVFIAEKRKTDNRHENIAIGHNHTLCIVSPRQSDRLF
jgi:hypothetical protein